MTASFPADRPRRGELLEWRRGFRVWIVLAVESCSWP